MTQNYNHEHYMALALELAEQGRYTCDPNPMVGCVIVRNNEILGRGYHIKAGEGHAEVNAIADALSNTDTLDGADIYVTLEPCSHTGRTPPCCQAIEQHNFKRVIIACQDPNPLVGGKGIARLSAKYEIIKGILEEQALELNHAFFYRMEHQKPWVQIKMGASLDARTALANGKSKWITCQAARNDVHKLRLGASAILTGKKTMLLDKAQLDARETNLGFAPQRQPLRIILDTNAESLDVVSDQIKNEISPMQRTLIITEKELTETQKSIGRLDTLSLDTKNIPTLLEQLNPLQINTLMVEAGAALTSSFLKANAVDEIVLYLAPKFLGPTARGLFDLPELKDLPIQNDWYFHHIEIIDTDLKIILRRC